MKKVVFFMMAMVVCASFAQAGEMIVSGSQERVDAVGAFLMGEGVTVKREYTTNEVMGSLKGESWPGVNVVSDGMSGSGIFVPISNNAVKNGLCIDQKRLLMSIIPSVVSPTSAFNNVKKMRIVSNAGCDEGLVHGMVPRTALQYSAGATVDVFEILRRPQHREEGTEWKIKRLRVKPDGVGYPLQWDDEHGSCVRDYSPTEFNNTNIGGLLLPGETIVNLGKGASDVGRNSAGRFFTQGTFVIVPPAN